MFRRLTPRWAVVSGIVLAILSAACIQLSPITAPRLSGTGLLEAPEDASELSAQATSPLQAAASATAAARPTTRETVTVRRGTIAELLPANGRVAALDEIAVRFPLLGRVEAVLVKPGDTVEQGQLILQAEAKEIQRELVAARSRVELGSLRMEQSQAQAQARQRQAEQRVIADRLRRQKALQEAETGLRRALEDIERVKAGAPAAERRSAEAAVVSARSGVERAEAELARVSVGPNEAELKVADQQVWAARLALHRAEVEFARLKQGPDPAQLSAAERDIGTAQTAFVRARMDFERLMRGDQTAVTAAQREVQRAELALRTAQNTRIESGGSSSARRNAQAARDSAITNAKLSLQDAQERLNVARRPPPPAEVDIARRGMQSAEAALRSAQERYEIVKQGPDEMTLAAANQAVEAAQSAATAAERRHLELAAGPPAQVIAGAQDAVRGARATLAGAVDRLTEVNSRPTRTELQAAQERVDAATAALEQGQIEPEPEPAEVDPAAYDRLVLERNLEQDRAQVETLERDFLATNLVAPVSGVVSGVLVRAGDPVDRDTHVLSIARAGDPIVTVDVGDEDAARIAAGQRAVVTLEGAARQEYNATVIDLVVGPGGVANVARFDVDWTATPPVFGSAAMAVVTLREKADVLLVPQRAIRSSGQRRYVEYMEGESRRTADVTLGISGALDVEILTGLRDGQLILVGTATSSAASPTSRPATGATSP